MQKLGRFIIIIMICVFSYLFIILELYIIFCLNANRAEMPPPGVEFAGCAQCAC